MASVHSDLTPQRPVSAKIVVSGGFGVGKTTMVGSVSEIKPLRTEAAMTSAGLAVDDASQVAQKTTTTVAMDFGKLTVETGLVLYLFGTPGQDRFGFMWDDVVQGALGAIVLVDTRRLDDCYAAVDYFESRGLPFVVACNHFDGGVVHDTEEIRMALDVPADIPIFMTDAREPRKVRDALLELLEHVLARIEPEAAAAAPAPASPDQPADVDAWFALTEGAENEPTHAPAPAVVVEAASPSTEVPSPTAEVATEPVAAPAAHPEAPAPATTVVPDPAFAEIADAHAPVGSAIGTELGPKGVHYFVPEGN